MQQVQREREERERKEAEEKARKGKEEREREAPPVAHIGRTDGATYSPELEKTARKLAWLPYGIGGIVILGCVMVFGIGYLILNEFTPNSPTATNRPQTESSSSVVLTDTAKATLTSTPKELGVGSMMVSEKDGMVMVYVPAGVFLMGNDADEVLAECQKLGEDCSRDSFTSAELIHTVNLDAFWIDQTEITNAMYIRCVDVGACDSPYSTQSSTRDNYYGNPEFDDYPVNDISWEDAKVYCEWAGRHLPTEAEWEKAARGEDGRTYPWGNEWDVRTTLRLNFSDKNDPLYRPYDAVADDGYADTAPVGSYLFGASPYGAYDMAGNVLEWVADWYGENDYSASPLSNPLGPNSGTFRVVRGGAWFSGSVGVRSAIRVAYYPAPHSSLGFRCARNAE